MGEKHTTEKDLIDAIIDNNKTRVWINDFLNMIKNKLTEHDIKKDSEQIAMTLNDGLKVVIGTNRTIIRSEDQDRISLILPIGYKDVINGKYSHAPIIGDHFQNPNDAFLARFESNVLTSDEALIKEWNNAVDTEIKKRKKCAKKTKVHHNTFFYNAVMDLNYRKKLLAEIYGGT